MKTTSLRLAGVAGIMMLALALPVVAADKDKEVTITGEAKCAKCALHETDKCQTVIQVEEKGKTVTYYLTANDVSKPFHEKVCQEAKKVKAVGTVTKKDGKLELAVTKIDIVK